MNHAIKLGRFSSTTSSSIFSSSSLSSSVTKSSKEAGNSVRFVQVSSGHDAKEPKFTTMDAKNAQEKDKTLNVMEEAFGEGYSTRCDEEGFGGVYGGNDECNTEMKVVQGPVHHDSSQGSEVKEKEAARNQTKAHLNQAS